eukprot:CAMPEP_0170583822 /NCGR_PEP_ID=MMETSP0224-20130122/8351_1 /TAXON_ID=285029 /ORGANISM="Togula jolla, Strain CCCM 725" /LENGTH=202 /DNA_ID=CAMNT_0010907197 /DNA_START=5 /DNA_END=613 /DNA_ORIENTATION=+
MTHLTSLIGWQGLLFLLAAWLGPALGRSEEDARTRRLSGLSGASNDMAEDIECEVCKEAAERFPKLLEQRPSSEAEVLDMVSTFCEGRKHGDGFDYTLEQEGWVVTELDGMHKLERKPIYRDSRRNVMDSFAQRDGMKLACINTVKEYESDLARFLWKKARSRGELNSTEISERLCYKISRACKKRRRRPRNRDSQTGGSEL